MPDTRYELLVWLPSPMGDAVLCTPALRAIRRHFESAEISFFADSTVRRILSPSPFNDTWIDRKNSNPYTVAKILKTGKFTHAILFKNSFASALTTFLARIPERIGYARQGRGLFLTEKLYPPKKLNSKFKPISMVDYYLAVASWLGAETSETNLELHVDPAEEKSLYGKLPQVAKREKPLVIFVPGAAFGPSKCWPTENFAKTADWLIANFGANVVLSVSPNAIEKRIAREISDSCAHEPVNLAEKPLTLGELKALFSVADLVITNDTGPRHIAIALQRKVITLFGPNDPTWTDVGWEKEIKLIGRVPCAPCAKPVCEKPEHLCMQAITVQMVCDAAKKLLETN